MPGLSKNEYTKILHGHKTLAFFKKIATNMDVRLGMLYLPAIFHALYFIKANKTFYLAFAYIIARDTTITGVLTNKQTKA